MARIVQAPGNVAPRPIRHVADNVGPHGHRDAPSHSLTLPMARDTFAVWGRRTLLRACVGSLAGAPAGLAALTAVSAMRSAHSKQVIQADAMAAAVGGRAYMGALAGAIVGLSWPILPLVPRNASQDPVRTAVVCSLMFASGIVVGLALDSAIYEQLPDWFRPADLLLFMP